MANHHDEETVPERTTPQGTQEHGVEHGHEEKDVSFRPLFLWFGFLSVIVIITILVVTFGYNLWAERTRPDDVAFSPVFTQQPIPPAPRVLPNPIDSHPLSIAMQRGAGALFQAK